MTTPDEQRRALKASLRELDGCWLELKCSGCSHRTMYPVKLMAQRIDPRHQLAQIVPRLVCRECRRRPSTIYLCETPHREPCSGPAPGWSVLLYPSAFAEWIDASPASATAQDRRRASGGRPPL